MNACYISGLEVAGGVFNVQFCVSEICVDDDVADVDVVDVECATFEGGGDCYGLCGGVDVFM